MQLKINGHTFTCINTQLPVDGSMLNIKKDSSRVALYHTAKLSDQDNNPGTFRIYNKQKLNQYRINRIFDGITAEITDEAIESSRKEALLTGKCNVVVPDGVNLPEIDFNIVYDPDSMETIPFLPDVYTQDDEYVVYSLENYIVPEVLDMFPPLELVKFKTKPKEMVMHSKLYQKILRDIVCFNLDAIQYLCGKKPYFYNLGWMSIYDITVGNNSSNGFDSHVMINNEKTSWKFVSIHELWPIDASWRNLNKIDEKWGHIFKFENDDVTSGDELKDIIYQSLATYPKISEQEIQDNIIYRTFLGKGFDKDLLNSLHKAFERLL